MRCDDCGVERWKLDRHHIIPKSQGGSNETPNVINICANCHQDRHGGPNTDTLPWLLSQTPEAQAKRAATMRHHWTDPAFRTKQAVSHAHLVGVPRSAETKAKVSAALKGKPFSDAHRAALSEAHKGIPVKPETREKLSLVLRGRTFTDEHRANLSAAHRARGTKPPGYDGTIEPITKTCQQCGEPFEVGGRGRPKKSALYCSNRCSALAREAMRRVLA